MPIGPTLLLPSLNLIMMKIMPHLRIVVMRKRICHAEVREAVLLQGPGASLVGAARDLRVDRDEREPGIAGKFFGVWRPSMTGRDR